MAVLTWVDVGASKAGWKPALRGGGRAKVMLSGTILECGDRSPLWDTMTCHRVRKRGHARALQGVGQRKGVGWRF